VKHTLKNLKKRGFRIGALTDSTYTAENRRIVYQKMGINDYIDYVVSSHDIHAVKPDPKAFNAILKKMKAKRQESVFVGHAKDELDGARRFGLVTIGFNLDKDARANFTAKKFGDITRIIGELND
jgi:putative hydrolase of the HAD superfamily